MLWHAAERPHRQSPCGQATVPSVGLYLILRNHLGRWRD
jgi:hypothetical protein